MHIGTIGAANIAQAVAQHLLRVGHEVTLSNSRHPESLAALVDELGPGALAGTRAEAAAAEIVLVAVPWTQLETALSGLPAWNGRIVIDATNAFLSYAPDYQRADLGGRTSSEIVAGLVPGARVVKAFNTLFWKNIAADPHEGGGRRVLFLSGDNADAKAQVAALVESLGFAAIDLGDLVTGGRLQQLDGPLAGPNLIKLG